MHRSFSVNKETLDLNNIIDKMHVKDTENILTTVEYTCFPSTDELFPRIDHIVGYITSSSKLKKD